jgi:hypothetical protein
MSLMMNGDVKWMAFHLIVAMREINIVLIHYFCELMNKRWWLGLTKKDCLLADVKMQRQLPFVPSHIHLYL